MNKARVNHHSTPDEKIALFRSFFRGRDDVYPRRFESRKSAKTGYQPACANEWEKGLCDKRSVKCTQCPNQRFLAVTDTVIRWHLSGCDDRGRDFVMGLYPMLADETCFFLAADFDKTTWQEDVQAFVETCQKMNLHAALERSRSGNGAHVWLFFKEPVPAVLARKLGSCILTRTMENRPDMGLDSYDRFFPNQDTLPKGGLGSLIALPLQKKARKMENSVFLNEHFKPYPDQWDFLSTLVKNPRSVAEAIVDEGEKKNQVVGVRLPPAEDAEDVPWQAPPSRRRKKTEIKDVPEKLTLILGDQIYIPKNELSPSLLNRLLRLAAFQNPEFYKAQAMRLSTYDKPRIIACAEQYPRHIGLPRGCFQDIEKLFSELKIKPVIRDERFEGRALPVSFHGELRPEQLIAAKAMAAHDNGILAAATAFGKTVIAAWLIARRGVNTLVLVHRKQLMEQWVNRLAAFLGLPEESIGRMGGGRKKVTGTLDMALIQSLVRKGQVNDLVADYGHIVVDECHHLSARSFELVARRAKARFVTGLSATVTRKDGHHPIIFMQCGPVRYRVDARKQADKSQLQHKVIVRPTDFQSQTADYPDVRIQFQALYRELMADEKRNQLICGDVIQAVRSGRSPIVLTERTEHLNSLAKRLEPEVQHLLVYRGGMGKKAMADVSDRLAAIDPHEERVLLATGRYIGEGFDDQRLDTLFLTLPVSWKGTVAQYVGRLHRLHDTKHEVCVYDYADLNVPMLARMFDRRCRGYEGVGYTIELPASAVPGWPADAELPVDPAWKQDYAASVRRLIRDGVDKPLAALFVQAAGGVSAKTNVEGQARSATEAFLYQRLQGLPQTAGRFELNQKLPVSFDGRGQMEVDLLDMENRIAIEIDGSQHLEDPQAYRRDRRKDMLLQENGYMVLRFLASDVGTHLDDVLDAIIRTVVHRSRKPNAGIPAGGTGEQA
ncbi:MAG: TOTE conflict system archaeo-eukaryotic primase domain-containing protein [Desulfobacterales bacterium]